MSPWLAVDEPASGLAQECVPSRALHDSAASVLLVRDQALAARRVGWLVPRWTHSGLIEPESERVRSHLLTFTVVGSRRL